MKALCNRDRLVTGLKAASLAIDSRGSIPILANARFQVGESGLTISGTDMDRTISAAVPVDTGSAAGIVTANAASLAKVLGAIDKSRDVELEAGSDSLILRAGRTRYELPTLPEADWPILAPDAMFEPWWQLGAKCAAQAFGRTAFAISTEKTRYYLNGIYAHTPGKPGDPMKLVATDGHRLATHDLTGSFMADRGGHIIPSATVSALLKLMPKGGDISAMASTEPGHLRFVLGSVTMTTRTVDGHFPDYNRAIPGANDKRAEIDTAELMAAVKRVGAIASPGSKSIKLGFGKNELEISASSPESGKASEHVTVDYQGTALEIGFNAGYIADLCKNLDAPRITVDMGDAESPTIFRPVGAADRLVVQMPMRV